MTDIVDRLERLMKQGEDYIWRTAAEAATEIRQLRREKDEAYHERNQVVAALASIFPSGIARTDIPGWLPEWHGCVYIDLPGGQQVSWHYHNREAALFAHLSAYAKPWDGHSTHEKYERLAAFCRRGAPAVRPSGATPKSPPPPEV